MVLGAEGVCRVRKWPVRLSGPLAYQIRYYCGCYLLVTLLVALLIANDYPSLHNSPSLYNSIYSCLSPSSISSHCAASTAFLRRWARQFNRSLAVIPAGRRRRRSAVAIRMSWVPGGRGLPMDAAADSIRLPKATRSWPLLAPWRTASWGTAMAEGHPRAGVWSGSFCWRLN